MQSTSRTCYEALLKHYVLILLSFFKKKNPESTKTRMVKTIVEEMVDGRVVSSQVKSVEEKPTK